MSYPAYIVLNNHHKQTKHKKLYIRNKTHIIRYRSNKNNSFILFFRTSQTIYMIPLRNFSNLNKYK